ncbi:glycoside hydrolase family 3 protein [Microbacterium sp. 18062]|uniref:glycoside hydrolase family 3 protein n=1 Tax=Microbacterium sp. 18062 TaxID=2681410 RepID=UPI00135B44C1|nr:glycoside hydrolase family 3 N-terminal domain-containing protein [Microbacterium sp. 18062]
MVHPAAPRKSRRGRAFAVTPDGIEYRDLNRNGVMDPYEDPRRPVEDRVADLMARMSVEEKAGLLYHAVASVSSTGRIDDDVPQPTRPVARELVGDRHVTHVNLQAIARARETARWTNELQELAESRGPHGIPVTFSSDPRHAFIENMGASFRSQDYSSWPEPIGLGALDDEDTVREFADIARREYLALGIRSSLHPTLDLATEPRWARQYSTFGADAERASRLGVAYLEGFQGPVVGTDSVACMAKHFPGGGPQLDGEDPHFPYGREQVYPGDSFEYHLLPFRRAVEYGVSAIMPYYGMPVGLVRDGRPVEEVGFGFNRELITGLLREELGYDGVICTDWGLINDSQLGGKWLPARSWGVEHLRPVERTVRALEAGCDQLGGENDPSLLLRALEQGMVSSSRVDESVRRLLRVKFRLGLFDDPYIDEEAAADLVGGAEYRAAGHRAQSRSITVLRSSRRTLPIGAGTRVYAPEIDRDALRGRALQPVEDATDADLAVLRMSAPFEHRDEYMLESSFHAGSLNVPQDEVDRIAEVASVVPVVLDVSMDRPAILTPLQEHADSLVASYGSSDAALLDALTGRIEPAGALPFDLPSSMADVEEAMPDVAGGMRSALYERGHGLTLWGDALPPR